MPQTLPPQRQVRATPSRGLVPVFLLIGLYLLGVCPAGAFLSTNLQMQLGNPSGATADTNNHSHYLLVRTVEAIDYNDSMGQPNWASWDLTDEDLGSSGRTDAWAVDTNLPPNFYLVPINAYSGSGYDRGHLCPSADRTKSVATNELVFFMSNIMPQASLQNQNIWGNFESYCRQTLLPGSNELAIICGPSSFTTNKLSSDSHITIPAYTWKIVVVAPRGSDALTNRIAPTTQVIALRIPNTDAVGYDAWQSYRTNVLAIEAETGFTFFTALAPNVAMNLRSKIDGQTPPAPGIASFSPTSGFANTTVTITGTNLSFTTNVTFNGVSASFSILSNTNLTATVPLSTATGVIQVAGLGGTATSAGSFVVGTGGVPDLAIRSSHGGNFTQGQIGATYTLTITNQGTAAASGTVTVTDTLPAGFTATSLSGSGWTADLGTVTCTRSDSLPPGAAYPAITLAVNVSTSADSALTNLAAVSAAGDTNLVNNTTADPTTVNPAMAPTAVTGVAAAGTSTATLNGTVNPNGQPTTVWFEYGLTTGYGATNALPGTLIGTSNQSVNAALSGLLAGTTYHFRLAATNVLGSALGADQTFTTTIPDLAVVLTRASGLTQGYASSYTIIVTNVGTGPTVGTISVTNLLPAGLTATGISGSGWATNLATLTCTRSDSLAPGTAYPAITISVLVAGDAVGSVTNMAIVAGGGEVSLANNTAVDVTTIGVPPIPGLTILAGWDVSTQPGGADNFGDSPLTPTTNAANLTVGSLTRGAGVGTSGTGASRGWGGNSWLNTNATTAISSNRFATFTVAANAGYTVSFAAVSKFDYRRSSTGATNGLLQYQIGAGPFVEIASFSYPSNTTAGGALDPINLSSISPLQGVGAGTNVTFRIVNWSGSGSTGTWYIFDVANSAALDFVLQGTVTPVVVPAADLAVGLSHSGNFIQGDSGRTYTISVTNAGTAATAGTVTVSNSLPAGLVATDLGGTGWTANLATLTCTRSDGLAAGSSYPPITLTVSVLPGAPATVTNIVTANGGGDLNATNNVATDPTTIIPASAPTAATGVATALGTSTVTLNGTVNPHNQPATAWFEYGLTASYGSNAAVAGTFIGATNQDVSVNLTGLLPGTTYHFRLAATNVLGGALGTDQTFTTTIPDLAVLLTRAGGLTQGYASSYTIVVTNLGTGPSAGTVSVTNLLSPGLTASSISGSGWTTDLATLSCARADTLAAGAAYPAITLNVTVAASAPASATNTVTVAGGSEAALGNNTASDVATVYPPPITNLVVLAGWDVSGLPGGSGNYGPSPLTPTTNAANLTVTGLTRGAGVGTSGTGAARGWGGNTWINTNATTAIASNRFATFGVAANGGYTVSFSAISKFDYRRSSTSATNGLLQYQIGSGPFIDLATLFYPSNTSAGGSVDPINLANISALQGVGAGTNVTFRIVNWGGTDSTGTWYVFDVAKSTALDFVLEGTVTPAVVPAADLAVNLSHAGSFTQGDTGRTYAIVVTNGGMAATAGTVTVTNFLPAGLVATDLSGSGWTANLGALSCTRSDTLAAGASYPPITLTVNVLTNAPAAITNVATVAGGGELNTTNNVAADPTTIVALAPIELWRYYWFGTTANSGPAADTAVNTSDGMANLLKYGLGFNPLVATNDPTAGDISTGYLRLTVPRDPQATDVTFHVEIAPTLTALWTTNGTTVEVNTPSLLRVRADAPVSTTPSGFIRLRVSRP